MELTLKLLTNSPTLILCPRKLAVTFLKLRFEPVTTGPPISLNGTSLIQHADPGFPQDSCWFSCLLPISWGPLHGPGWSQTFTAVHPSKWVISSQPHQPFIPMKEMSLLYRQTSIFCKISPPSKNQFIFSKIALFRWGDVRTWTVGTTTNSAIFNIVNISLFSSKWFMPRK